MCQECDWESVLTQCAELLEDPDYAFAEDTLVGIHDWIEAHEHVTPAQEAAVSNIENCK